MASRPTLIVDVDNTLIAQDVRKTVIIQEVFELRHLSLADVTRDFSLDTVMSQLNPQDQRRFWDEFLSPEHYGKDDALTVSAFPGSREALQELHKTYSIAYLTGRPDVDGQEAELLRQLQIFGFPVPDSANTVELHLMPPANDVISNSVFAEHVRNFKRDQVLKICAQHNVAAGVGDTEEDMDAYKNAGVLALQFLPNDSSRPRSNIADLSLPHWDDISNAIHLALGDDNALSDLVDVHIREYGEWLGHLDAKSRLLLVINAAVLGGAIALVRESEWSPASYAFASAAFLAGLAMIFCIRAFSSRHIRGALGGETASLGTIRTFGHLLCDVCKCLIGGQPVPQGSPIEDSEELKEAAPSRVKVAHIQFFFNNYATVNPIAVRNRRLYELRSMNYVKIYGEQWGRRFSFLAIGAFMVGFVLWCTIRADTSTPQQQPGTQGQSNTNVTAPPVTIPPPTP